MAVLPNIHLVFHVINFMSSIRIINLTLLWLYLARSFRENMRCEVQVTVPLLYSIEQDVNTWHCGDKGFSLYCLVWNKNQYLSYGNWTLLSHWHRARLNSWNKENKEMQNLGGWSVWSTLYVVLVCSNDSRLHFESLMYYHYIWLGAKHLYFLIFLQSCTYR